MFDFACNLEKIVLYCIHDNADEGPGKREELNRRVVF